MRHTLLALATIAAAAPALASSSPGPSADHAAAARIAAAILAAQLELNGVPGMAASVTRDGQIVWEGTAGMRDLARQLPVTRETSFGLASVSKLLTVTAAIKLNAQGRLDLDRPVQDMVPGLNPAWPAITARQLAAHTSGLPHYQEIDAGRGGEHFPTAAAALRNFADRPLLTPPGQTYRYSSWGYTLLSAAVEAAAGEPFADHVGKSITAGLRIVPGTEPADAQTSVGYTIAGGRAAPVPAHNYSYSLGGAGFRGSASSLAMFGSRVMDDGFVSAEARRTMWTPARLADYSPVREQDSAVAFGWRIGRDPFGGRIAHHAGSTPAARSVLVLYPDEDLAVAVLSNTGWVSAIEQTAVMLAAPFRVKQDGAGPHCPTTARRYEGTFGSERIAGTVRFTLVRGHCQGRLATGNAVGAWLDTFPRKDTGELRVLALSPGKTLGQAALVTPIGTYAFRPQGDGTYHASLGTNRELKVRFDD